MRSEQDLRQLGHGVYSEMNDTKGIIYFIIINLLLYLYEYFSLNRFF